MHKIAKDRCVRIQTHTQHFKQNIADHLSRLQVNKTKTASPCQAFHSNPVETDNSQLAKMWHHVYWHVITALIKHDNNRFPECSISLYRMTSVHPLTVILPHYILEGL